jgi:hypothetical protein
MIHVPLPQAPRVRITGGTTEERELHGRALAEHFDCEVAFYPADYAHVDMTFAEAMAQMEAAHEPLARAAVEGMDSMLGALR